MTKSKQILGRWGESLAADYLSQKGYEILDRNYRTPYGEIDLVARQEETTVFVEVKTRSSSAFGLPETAITREKRAHLVAAAQSYFQERELLPGDWRIDVIAIRLLQQGTPPEITHFENAVS